MRYSLGLDLEAGCFEDMLRIASMLKVNGQTQQSSGKVNPEPEEVPVEENPIQR